MSSPFRSKLLAAMGIVAGAGAGWFARGAFEETGDKALSGSASAQPGWTRSAANADERPGGSRAGSSDSNRPGLSAGESKNFAETTRSIFRDPLTERRLAQFRSLVEKAGPEQLRELVDLIRENDLRGADSGKEWTMLWMKWGQEDPAGALNFIREMDWKSWDPRAPAEAESQAISAWAEQDPDAVLKFIQENHANLHAGSLLGESFIRGWAGADPEAAGAWILKQDAFPRDEFKRVVEAISRKGGPEAVDAWFAAQSKDADSPGLARMAEAIVAVKGEYQPEKAAAWIEENIKEPWIEQSEVVSNTARDLANRDPEAAMAWAQRMGLRNAVTQVIDQWLESDMQAATTWLKGRSAEPDYGDSVNVLISHLMPGDPVAARQWAESIPDPAARANVLSRLPKEDAE